MRFADTDGDFNSIGYQVPTQMTDESRGQTYPLTIDCTFTLRPQDPQGNYYGVFCANIRIQNRFCFFRV